MSAINEFRTSVQGFYRKYQRVFAAIFRLIVSVIIFSAIRSNFGYVDAISKPVVPYALSVICAFSGFAGMGILALGYLVVELIGASIITCVVTAVLGVLLIAAASYFSREEANMVWAVPFCAQLGIPAAVPMAAGLGGQTPCAPGIFCGCIMSYYVKALIDYAPSLADAESNVTPWGLLISQVFSNSAFYVFAVSMMVMAIVINLIYKMDVSYAWALAAGLGTAIQFLIRASGIMFFHSGEVMGLILKDEVLTLLGTVLIMFFVANLDYSRTEHVKFEDDDYVYYVRAIPKATVSKAQKQVRNITRDEAAKKAKKVERPAQPAARPGSRPAPRPQEARKVDLGQTSVVEDLSEYMNKRH